MSKARLTLRGVSHLHHLGRRAEARSNHAAGGRVIRGVEAIDLTLDAGVVLGLAGPNGAGKTTLLRIIAGILPSSQGRISDDGMHRTNEASQVAARARIGFMPERVGWSGVGTPLTSLSRIRSMRPSGRTAMEALDLVGLASRAHDPLVTLSQGMRQRLSLASALLDDPDLLLLDEPMNGLDPVAQAAFRRMIAERAAGGCSVIVSSHQLSDLERICEEVAILDRGRLIAHGSFTAVEQALDVGQHLIISGTGPDPQNLVRDLYPDARIEEISDENEDCWSYRLTRHSVAWNTEMRASLNDALIQSGRRIHHLERAPPDLEALLREATGQEDGLALREVEEE